MRAAVATIALSGLLAVGGPGVSLSSPAPDLDAASPQVALDARGDAFAVWRETTPAGIVTEAATKLAGRGWSSARVLASGGYGQLSVNARGDAVVAGLTLTTSSGVFAVYRRAGGSWGPARLLARSGTGVGSGWVSTAIDDSGTALVTWSSGGRVEVATRAGHGRWSRRSLGAGGESAVALDARGDALVVWHTPIGGDGRTVAAWKQLGRPWQRPQLLPQPPGELAFPTVPQVALDDRGNGVVVWTGWSRASGAYMDLAEAASARVGRRFGPPQQVAAGFDDVWARLAGAGDGRAAVVYVTGRDDGPVWVTTRTARGRPFGPPIRLAEQDAFGATAAITPSGRVLAVWTQADGQLTVTGAVVRPDGSFSSPTQLGVAGDDCWMHRCLAGGMGSVALGADGRGVIAWVEKANPYRANGGVVYARTVDVGGL